MIFRFKRLALSVVSIAAFAMLLTASPAAAVEEIDADTPPMQQSAGNLEAEAMGVGPDDLSSVEEEIYFAPEEIVTGPTKYAVPLAESPTNIYVITHEDIMQSGQTTLGEILRRVPGMDAIWITSNETQVSMRGYANSVINGTRMAVLVDGRVFYHEFISGTFWQQVPVPLADIKRIEVIKGPMSSLYGNKAMLGIINIVTFEPEETRTTLEGGGGNYWTATGDFIHAGKFADGYWYKVTGTYLRNNDYNDWRGTGKQKAGEKFAATGEFLFKPIDTSRISLKGGITQSQGLIQFGALVTGKERRGFVDMTFDQELGEWGDFALKSYWERHLVSSPDFPGLGTLTVDNVEAEARHTIGFDITDDIRNTLTYGFDYRYGDVANAPVRVLNNFAGYLQDEFRFFEKLIFTGGARVDYQHNFAGLNVSAHGSLVFLPKPFYTFRIGFGSAFNNPNYLHYYTNLAQAIVPGGIGTLLGNPGLKAEKILYLNVGNQFHPIERLTINADFFWYRMNNLITPVASITPPATLTAQYQNDGGAQAIGGEVSIEGQITDWLEGYTNYAYERFNAINGNINPTPNLGSPKHKVNAGLRGYWFDRRLTANLEFHWVYKYYRQAGTINFSFMPVQRMGDVYFLNVRLAYWPIKDHLEIAVNANNILDDNSPQTPLNDPLFGLTLAERPRFNIWGSLRYVF